ncbi:MAG: hypothetical protein ACMG6E_05185 [Candidatus Roizmanbacteria bacterium]
MVKVVIIDVYFEVDYLVLPFRDEGSQGGLGGEDLLLLYVRGAAPILYLIFQVTAHYLLL